MRNLFSGFVGAVLALIIALVIVVVATKEIPVPEGPWRLALFLGAAALGTVLVVWGNTTPKPPTTNAMGLI